MASPNWIDLSRYNLTYGMAVNNGACLPTIKGDPTYMREKLSEALGYLGFVEVDEGTWNVQWDSLPKQDDWNAIFPMHKVRPMKELASSVAMDEPTKAGLLARGWFSESDIVATRGHSNQPIDTTTQRAPERPWPDLTAYGLQAYLVKPINGDVSYVSFCGHPLVKSIYLEKLTAAGITAETGNEELSLKMHLNKGVTLQKLQAELPLIKETQKLLSDVTVTAEPAPPKEFDLSKSLNWSDITPEYIVENQLDADSLKGVVANNSGLDVQLMREEFGIPESLFTNAMPPASLEQEEEQLDFIGAEELPAEDSLSTSESSATAEPMAPNSEAVEFEAVNNTSSNDISDWPDFSPYGFEARLVTGDEGLQSIEFFGPKSIKQLYREELKNFHVVFTDEDGPRFGYRSSEKPFVLKDIELYFPLVKGIEKLTGESIRTSDRLDISKRLDGSELRQHLRRVVRDGRDTAFTMPELRKMAANIADVDEQLIRHEFGISDRDLQEHLETAIAEQFRVDVDELTDPSVLIDIGDALDRLMPKVSVKSGNSIALQQLSTPLAISSALQAAIHMHTAKDVWEPTAGNGSLVSMAPSVESVNGLEYDPERVKRLHEQGFIGIKQGNAITEPVGHTKYSRVIANPPFGSFPDGNGRRVFETDVPHSDPNKPSPSISLLSQDKYIALRQLENLSDDGIAGLILGADNPAQYGQGEYSESTEQFLSFLGDTYDVLDVSYVTGNLYSSRGAGWPLLMITTAGKRPEIGNYQLPEVLPVINSIDGLKAFSSDMQLKVGEVLEEINLQSERDSSQGGPSQGDKQSDESVSPDLDESQSKDKQASDANQPANLETSESVDEDDVAADERNLSAGEFDAHALDSDDTKQRHTATVDEKVAVYEPLSKMTSLNKRVPANLASPIKEALTRVERAHGDIDGWVADELGWSLAELEDRLAAEQVDAVALAMFQAEQGKGFILGDNTGVGKGRTVAALHAWGIKNGHKPIFITSKAGLFFDIMRDFEDIGEKDTLKPMIVNDTKDIKDPETGAVLLKSTPRNVVNKAIKQGVIPDEFNSVFLTYSQINLTIGKSPKARWLGQIAVDNYILADEVHNATGDSNTGDNLTNAIRNATFTLGSSATYAKRPDNLALFEFTSMFASGDPDSVIEAVAKGGPEYQEVLSTLLASSGQLMVRSHRPAPSPVARIVNPTYKEGFDSRELSDRIARVLDAMTGLADKSEDIVNSKNSEIKEFIDGLPDAAKGNFQSWKAQSLNFGSQAANIQKVAMYAAKADALVDSVDEAIKNGKRVTIAMEGTMEAFLKEAYTQAVQERLDKFEAERGEDDPMPDFGAISTNLTFKDTLKKYLDRMVVIKEVDRYGNESEDPIIDDMEGYWMAFRGELKDEMGEEITLDQVISKKLDAKLIEETQALTVKYYFAVVEAIEELPDSLPASPLDYVQSKLKERGIVTAEMTGRDLGLNYDTATGVPEFRRRTKEEKNRIKAANDFNNGDVQAIFFNAATAEGVSLNPNLKFKNQEPRHMIFWQVLGAIDAFNQQAGRIDRSGQDEKVMPSYEILVLDTPSEKRVIANLERKDGSLKANTRADRDTGIGSHGIPMINRVGDLVTYEVLNKHPDRDRICRKLKIELPAELEKFSSTGIREGTGSDTGLNNKLTGRLSRMELAESEPLMEELEEAYKERIGILDQKGINPLKTQIHDFQGDIVQKHVIFPRSGPSAFEGEVNALEIDYIDYIEPLTLARVEKEMAHTRGKLEERGMSLKPLDDQWELIEAGFQQRFRESGMKLYPEFYKSLPMVGRVELFIEAVNERPKTITKDEAQIERLQEMSKRFNMFKRLREQLQLGAMVKNFPVADAVFDCDVERDDMVITRIIPPHEDKDPCLGGQWTIRLSSPAPDVGQFDLSLNQLMHHMGNSSMRISNEALDENDIAKIFNPERKPHSVTRKRFVLDGQLFTAYEMTKNAKESGISRGKPGVYTLSDGSKRRGIVMPRDFDVRGIGVLMRSDFTIPNYDVVIDYIDKVNEKTQHPTIMTQASHDAWVYANNMKKTVTPGRGATITRDEKTGTWKLQVSAVKRHGGAYLTDVQLSDFLHNGFTGGSNKVMEGTFDDSQLGNIVERLMKQHGQVFHGDKEYADWYRDYIKARGDRLVQEQNDLVAQLAMKANQNQTLVAQSSPNGPV